MRKTAAPPAGGSEDTAGGGWKYRPTPCSSSSAKQWPPSSAESTTKEAATANGWERSHRSELVILDRDGIPHCIDIHSNQRKPARVQRLLRLLHERPKDNSSNHQFHFPPHNFLRSALLPAAGSPSKPGKPVHGPQKTLHYRLHLHSNRVGLIRANSSPRAIHYQQIFQQTHPQRFAEFHNHPIADRHVRGGGGAVCQRGMEDVGDGDEGFPARGSVVSGLFANVLIMLSVPVVPAAGVLVLHDQMNGVKVISMVLAVWGFLSFAYEEYVKEKKEKDENENAPSEVPLVERGNQA
nr:probable purine permease 9 [Ipomoea batatas]